MTKQAEYIVNNISLHINRIYDEMKILTNEYPKIHIDLPEYSLIFGTSNEAFCVVKQKTKIIK